MAQHDEDQFDAAQDQLLQLIHKLRLNLLHDNPVGVKTVATDEPNPFIMILAAKHGPLVFCSHLLDVPAQPAFMTPGYTQSAVSCIRCYLSDRDRPEHEDYENETDCDACGRETDTFTDVMGTIGLPMLKMPEMLLVPTMVFSSVCLNCSKLVSIQIQVEM